MKDSLSALIECKIFNELEVKILVVNFNNKKNGLCEYVNELFKNANFGLEAIKKDEIHIEFCKTILKNQFNAKKKHLDMLIEETMKRYSNFFSNLKAIIKKFCENKDDKTFENLDIIENYKVSNKVIKNNLNKFFERSCSKNLDVNIIKKMNELPDSEYFKTKKIAQFYINMVYRNRGHLILDDFYDQTFADDDYNLNPRFKYFKFIPHEELIYSKLNMINELEKNLKSCSNKKKDDFFIEECVKILKKQDNKINQTNKVNYLNVIHNKYNSDYHSQTSFDCDNMENYKYFEIPLTIHPHILSTIFFLFSFCYLISIFS